MPAGIRPADQFRKLTRGFNRCFVSSLDDIAGNAARVAFFAVLEQDSGDLLGLEIIDGIGGARSRLTHAHVERCVAVIGKPAFGIVKLEARDTQIHQYAVDLATLEPVWKITKIALNQLKVCKVFATHPFERVRVLIDPDHARARLKQQSRVARTAERRIDDQLAGTRLEHFQHLERHDRLVNQWFAHVYVHVCGGFERHHPTNFLKTSGKSS